MYHIDFCSRNTFEHIYRDFFIDRGNITGIAAWHTHNTGEFILAECGQSIATAGDETIRLKAPYLIYYPPYVPHSQMNDAAFPYSRYCLSVDPGYLSGAATELPQSFFAFTLEPEEYAKLEKYVSILHHYYAGGEHSTDEISFARRKYLLLLFLNEVTPMIAARSPDLLRAKYRYISDVCAYIGAHIGDKIALEQLADQFFISRTKLTQDFRTAKGLSVGDYITAVRISQSKLLLRDGMRISDIAHECGFVSSAYFIRVFEKLNGATPAKFRESLDKHLFFDNDVVY